jgi:hypothetical protein
LVRAPAAVVAFVPPDPTAKVTDKPAAVPEVLWFRVGKLVMLAADRAGAFLNVGAAATPEVDVEVRTASVDPVVLGET